MEEEIVSTYVLHYVIYINRNYWIKLSTIWKNYGDRGVCYPPTQITLSKIFIILQIIQKPNLVIVLLFIQNDV